MIDQRAKELGRLVGQSEEFRTLKRANDALGEDAAAVAALHRMEALRAEAQRLLARGEEPSAEMEKELDDLLGSVQVTSSYQRVVAAQENFDKLMYKVNGWISEGIKAGSASPIITLA